MERELQKGGEGGGAQESLVSVLEEEVKTATDLLLLTNFSACLEICQRVIASIKSRDDRDSDTVDRLHKVQEAATVIGIQALAEQGTWKEVIPFVENVYSHMAACPPTIMQMCLLLHSHVREYLVCHWLIAGWLDYADHRHLPESGALVSTYVTNVLLPLRAYNLIPQIVEQCTALSSEEKQALLSPQAPSSPRTMPEQDRGLSCPSEPLQGVDPVLKSEPRVCVGKDDENKPKGLKVFALYLNLSRKLWRALARKGWCRQLRKASKLFFLISFIILALIHVQTDVTANFSRAMELWKTAAGALYSRWRRQPLKVV